MPASLSFAEWLGEHHWRLNEHQMSGILLQPHLSGDLLSFKQLKFLFVAIPLLASISAARQNGASPSIIALTHASVIDGTGSPPQTDMTVLVKGRRISAVFRTGTRTL